MARVMLACSLVLAPLPPPAHAGLAGHAGLGDGPSLTTPPPVVPWADTGHERAHEPPPPPTTTPEAPAPTIAPPTTIAAAPLTLRERALGQLAALGAPPWVIAGFDCIGRHESGWRNARSSTGDSGVFQINDVHRPELARLGLDPWLPEDAATFALQLWARAGGSWRDWTVAPLCNLT